MGGQLLHLSHAAAFGNTGLSCLAPAAWSARFIVASCLTTSVVLLQGAWLVAAGGVIYTVGGTIYAFRWPNPSPKYFGYHEIFHAATLLASLCHFSAV